VRRREGDNGGGVLVEFTQVKQEAAGHRRWFEDDGMELIVWYDAGGRATGFQLCYQWKRQEHALTWQEGRGFTSARVDAGDTRPEKNLTPVLVPDGTVPWRELREDFARRAANLDEAVRAFVSAKLEGTP
jgi:hypothetical protein